MTTRKTTKRALGLSVLSLVLCLAMLVGTTFAWFTDSVTSENNIIKSGILRISMDWADGTEDPATANWKDASKGAIFNYELWEPGYTEVKHIRIMNKDEAGKQSNLALKYNLRIVPTGTPSKLAEVIDVYSVVPTAETTDLQNMATQIATRADMSQLTKLGTLQDILNENGVIDISGVMLPTDTVNSLTIALKMQEEAGNEYQDIDIGSNFRIVLTATQYTYEEDSFDDQYDAQAKLDAQTIPATDLSSLKNAIQIAKDGDTIQLSNDVNLTEAAALVIDKELTLDLAGKTLAYTGTETLKTGVLQVKNGGSLTVTGNGTIDGGKAYAAIAMTVPGDTDFTETSKLVIENGTFTAYYYAITGNGSRHNTDITINGGSFTATADKDNLAIYHPQQGKLTINGGTFTGYNSAIEIRAGELVINDGTFSCIVSKKELVANDNGTTTKGAVIAVAQHTTKLDLKVTVKGGSFSGGRFGILAADNQGNGTENVWVTVTGGNYSDYEGPTFEVRKAQTAAKWTVNDNRPTT